MKSTCQRYVKRGGLLPVKAKAGRYYKLDRGQRAWLTSRETLIQQAPLSLAQRCKIIEQKYQKVIH